MVKKKNKNTISSDSAVVNSDDMRKLVDTTLQDMKKYDELLKDATDPVEARLRIKQMYFNNLKAAGEPVALSQRLVADMLTRLDVARVIGSDTDPLSNNYFRTIEALRQMLKTQSELEGKKVNVVVSKKNDADFKIVDAEVMEDMF